MKITIIIEEETRVEVSREFSNLTELQFLDMAKTVWKNAESTIQSLASPRHLVVKDAGTSLLNTIKILREFSGIGLVEAKNFVESGPRLGIPKIFNQGMIATVPGKKEECLRELRRVGTRCDLYTDDEIATLDVMQS